MHGTVAEFYPSQRPPALLCRGHEAGDTFFSFPPDLVVKPLSLMLRRKEEIDKLNLKRRIITKRLTRSLTVLIDQHQTEV